MKVRLVTLLLVLPLLIATSPALAADPTCEPDRQPLESNEFFEAHNNNEVTFHEGIYFELVRSSDGESSIRYGFDQDHALKAQNTLTCRCTYPNVCSKSSCAASSTGGSATCSGGCYRPNGTACVSCQFH